LFARLKWFIVFVLIITVIALGVALLLSGMMHRPISGPILDLAMTMKKVSEDKEYTLRAQKRSSDEVGQLITGFNEMLAQIQDRDAALERYTVELQNSNAELKSFIYSAAHDLRQPLVNIKGFTHELVRSLQETQAILHRNSESLPAGDRNRIAAIFEEDVQSSSGFIVSSVEQMASLINALLKLSQVSSRDLRPEPVSMETLVQSSLRGMHQQIQEQNVSVTVGDLPDVTADRTVMEQIMKNLLDNAVKYLDRERPGRIEIRGELTDAGIVYRVRDNGRGIAAADISKVFDLFRRAGKPDIPGLGVGLAYVRALVRLHGGRIWCESEEGVGSTFSLMLPQDKRSPRPLQEKP
jgi:signal transduction histidine kinase